MDLHFPEHGVIVDIGTHGVELLDGGNSGLLVLVLGRNPESRAADQLVVLLEGYSSCAVPVYDVPAEKEGLGLELEGGMHLDYEVDEIGSHEPLDLWLEVDHGRVDGGLGLERLVMGGNGVEVLGRDDLVFVVFDGLKLGGVGLAHMSAGWSIGLPAVGLLCRSRSVHVDEKSGMERSGKMEGGKSVWVSRGVVEQLVPVQHGR